MIRRLLSLFRHRTSSRVPSLPAPQAAAVLAALHSGQVRRLPDDQLCALVQQLLAHSSHRQALRGNERFLQSVLRTHAGSGKVTLRQRYALYNILERAYVHNLPSHLRPR